MLVLTRKIEQRIYIGESIILTILGVERSGVRIGIEAPTSIPILREELVSVSTRSSDR